MKNMDITNLVSSMANIKQHGDAVRIAKIVNDQRKKKGLENISSAYVRSMLNGQRKITDEVAEITEKYFEAQKSLID